MALLPELTTTAIERIDIQPSYTYYLNVETNRISGFVDQLSAMEQSIYLILNIERFESYIFDWDYGSELWSLLGHETNYVFSELQRRITEALKVDDRIMEVTNFEITQEKEVVTCIFDVYTTAGNLQIRKDVIFNV